MSADAVVASSGSEVLVLVDGMTPGMPLGPTLNFEHASMLVSVYGGSQRPQDLVWTTVPIVAAEELPALARAAVTNVISEHVGDSPWPARRPPWFRHDWLEQAEDWIDEQLRALNLVRAAAPVPARVWSLSAVLQVPIAGGAEVWFKASCDHFRAEPAITRAVGGIATSFTPTVLASDYERAWMLLAPLPPTAGDPPCRIEAAARAISTLQLQSIDHLEALRAAGCPDRGLRPTLDAFATLLEDRGRFGSPWPWIEDRIGSFFAGGVPLTLVHGDLHLDNVAGDAEPVIYDWSDGCISHPFIDGAHLVDRVGAAHHAQVRDICLAAWGDGAEAVWELAPLADRVFQAVTHDAIGRSLEPGSAWETAGATERLIAEIERAYASR